MFSSIGTYEKRSIEMIFKKTLCPMLYALCIIVLLGCQAAISTLKPPLEEEGEVFLYVEPFPQEAGRLRFTLDKVFVVSHDGREFPLEISLHELKAPEMIRQRLLASGRLPAGSYAGISFKVKRAVLKVEEGEADLLIPEAPARIDFPFSVNRKRAYVLSLTFRYAESISGGFSFRPLFSIIIPSKPLTSLTGYVSNYGSNNIIVFEKKSGRVVRVIATGRGPSGMALDQRPGRAYVALSGDDSIALVDVASNEVSERLRLNTGDQPLELALTSDGKILLTVNKGSNTVSFINAFSFLEIKRVNVDKGPNSISIHPNGRRAFVFNTFSGTISVIDINNKAIITSITVDPGPLRGQFNRRGDRLYVIHEWSPYLTVLDPLSLSVLKRYRVRIGMASIKVDNKTDLVYMGRGRDTVADVFEPVSFVVVDSIQTGAGITYMTIDGDENNLYLVCPDKRSLMVSNVVRKRVLSELDVGEGPYWVVIMGER